MLQIPPRHLDPILGGRAFGAQRPFNRLRQGVEGPCGFVARVQHAGHLAHARDADDLVPFPQTGLRLKRIDEQRKEEQDLHRRAGSIGGAATSVSAKSASMRSKASSKRE